MPVDDRLWPRFPDRSARKWHALVLQGSDFPSVSPVTSRCLHSWKAQAYIRRFGLGPNFCKELGPSPPRC